MIITIDFLEVQQIGFRLHRNRYYYAVLDYPNLLLVCQGGSFEEFQGKKAVLLWNFEGIDSTIVCDAFPDAPQRWRHEQIVQASITAKERMKGTPIMLSEALKRKL